MSRLRCFIVAALTCLIVHKALGNDPVAAWRGAKVRPVSTVPNRHTMHTYYLLNPESPDGSRILFFASTDKEGHTGNVVVQDRATGTEIILAENVHTEDAHRVALQQWFCGGRLVAYHQVVEQRWQVVVVDVATREKRVVAMDRQLGFAQNSGELLPMYGCHWNPGEFRDLYLWNAATGETTTPVTIAEVEAKHADWLKEEFADRPTSIAFPTLSPDLNRVFFKISAGNGGHNFRAKNASHRQGIVFYDFRKGRLTWQRNKWGHPAWHPDSQHVLEMGNLLFDADGAPYLRIPDVPVLRGMHPSISADGKLWVTDGLAENVGGSSGQWAVMVADFEGTNYEVVHRFANAQGARSWRRSHPHPVFSTDGQRIYFNVSDGAFTRLFVAEIAGN